jgi:hypothetical protein
MKNDMRPIWQILIAVMDSSKSVNLNCDECFVVMEYMVDQAVLGADKLFLEEIVERHLENCPDCREHHMKRIRELEKKTGKEKFQ